MFTNSGEVLGLYDYDLRKKEFGHWSCLYPGRVSAELWDKGSGMECKCTPNPSG